jgi:methionine salvage enolase-phosphatase E1
MDKLSYMEEQQLQISLNQGGKKQATFFEKLAKTQGFALTNYGFLSDQVNVNELAARGVNISIRDHLKA